MNYQAYAASEPGARLEAISLPLPDQLRPFEVDIQVEYCGICHSDVHLIDNDWGISAYPLVPGHEVVGTVVRCGPEVRHLKVGQRVGVGWQSGSCLHCEWCASGWENLCAQEEATCVGRPGGFAERLMVDSRFAFPLPESLSPEVAAPLLCAGITVYSPLVTWQVTAGDRVAVVGVGGLGHLAIQFARALGCEVAAISHSPEKAREVKQLGAHHFIQLDNREQFKSYRRYFDFILSTVYHPLDWKQFLLLLRPRGKLCFVGAPGEPLNFSPAHLLEGHLVVCASTIGSRHQIMQMLRFAALHDITAKTEVVPVSRINAAIDKVRQGAARYRMVLKMNP
ncbi:MAG: NAD(P)-dependent alcohol dehydrogenase [Calditrichaeota bacterium]|nr:NAD(P)-dependent alcohol dehydrogenase [Calditrichota bacterium]